MLYNEHLKDDILAKADLVDVISEVVSLKKRGDNYLGLCPFHKEKTPSFTVSPNKGIYKCFGCGKAGNVITFMRDYYGLSFKEALRELAEKYNIPYEENISPETAKHISHQELIYKALDFANGFFQQCLNDKIGEKALAYFRSRGFDNATIEKFGLGFSPDGWNELQNFLHSMNFENDVLLDAGLLIKKENSDNTWDRFRGRAMFPIYSITGKVIGFGARDINKERPENSPKYLNSPQTSVYDKSNAVYGLFVAKNEIRAKKEAILTEGYADVISLHKAGFSTAIASCGTSLTPGQLKELKRYAEKLYISYDGDSAGINAALKALEIALPFGFDIKVVCLPKGEDPDSIIAKNGENEYRRYLDDAKSFVDFVYHIRMNENKLESPSQKSDFVRFIVKLIVSIPDRLQHDFYISRVSALMNLTENQLRDLYRNKKKVEQKNEQELVDKIIKKTNFQVNYDNNYTLNPEPNILEFKLFNVSAPEKMLFDLIVEDQTILDYCSDELGITENYFDNDCAGAIFATLLDLKKKNLTVQYVAESESEEYDDDVINWLIESTLNAPSLSRKWQNYGTDEIIFDKKKMVTDILTKMELAKTEAQIAEIQTKINEKDYEIDDLRRLAELNLVRTKLKDSLNM